MDNILKDVLTKICDYYSSEVSFNEPLLNHSTIRIGGRAEAFYSPRSPEELSEVLNHLQGLGKPILIVGNGSNILFPDGILESVVITLANDFFKFIKFEEDMVKVGAGKALGALISESAARGYSAFEGLIGIPGTVGGALKMNASYKTAISDFLLRVKVVDINGNIKYYDRKDIKFGYRKASFADGDIIVEAEFRLEKRPENSIREDMRAFFMDKMTKQPFGERTLGCVFKNPGNSNMTTAQIIEELGMKGSSQGGASVSEKHANFIVNKGAATASDVVTLMERISDAVCEKYSIKLIPEILIVK